MHIKKKKNFSVKLFEEYEVKGYKMDEEERTRGKEVKIYTYRLR